MEKIYDVVIIGAGPAGLSAGIYAGRARLSTLVIEKEKNGGQIVTTSEIENYPGCDEVESGPTLTAKMVKQMQRFGAERVSDNIIEVALDGKIKVVRGEKCEYKAKTVIIAGGAKARTLGCPGEKQFTGKGVSYCATCDGPFFEELETFVVGGGDSAVEEAMFLTKFARKVTIVQIMPELTCAKSIKEKALANPKIEVLLNTKLSEIKGNGVVESVVLTDTVTNESREVFADEDDGTFGVFIFIGFAPQTEIYQGKINMDRGYIVTDDNMHTNIPGVFAAGDIRVKTLRQVVTAVADGAIAAVQAEKYLEKQE